MEFTELTTLQHEVLTGLLLGDGCLWRSKRGHSANAQLAITRTKSDFAYLQWSADIFQNFVTPKGVRSNDYFDRRTQKTYSRVFLRTRCNPCFTEVYHKWYPNGKKIVPRDLKLTIPAIQVWFADDGCVSRPRGKRKAVRFELKIATHGFLPEDVDFLRTSIQDVCGVTFYRGGDNTLRMGKTSECRDFLRQIDSGFPLERKSRIWRNPDYKLFESLDTPECKFCKGSTFKNGTLGNKQTYQCRDCLRQFRVTIGE